MAGFEDRRGHKLRNVDGFHKLKKVVVVEERGEWEDRGE